MHSSVAFAALFGTFMLTLVSSNPVPGDDSTKPPTSLGSGHPIVQIPPTADPNDRVASCIETINRQFSLSDTEQFAVKDTQTSGYPQISINTTSPQWDDMPSTTSNVVCDGTLAIQDSSSKTKAKKHYMDCEPYSNSSSISFDEKTIYHFITQGSLVNGTLYPTYLCSIQ
ncbi:hypothetical protein BDF19DRAFT_413869 [Syncephalis fuscata]|nr:hypothetical protein BDF19DRAFT_413869 [Syncephalis fuscata]